MAILSEVSRKFSSFITPHKPALRQRYPTPEASDTHEQPYDDESVSPLNKTKDWLEATADDDLEDLDGETLLETSQRTLKRSLSPRHHEERSVKRRKRDDGYHPDEDGEDGQDEEESDFEGDTLLASTPGPRGPKQVSSRTQEDRRAMPPPPRPGIRVDDLPYVPDKNTIDRNLQNNIVLDGPIRRDSIISDEEIFTKKTAVRREDRSEVNPQFEFDRALRHAKAQELPNDSGIWSEAEKDVFYRLAMRGFEPLVPGHWTVDFKTLPHQLFASGEQEPLIAAFEKREFRAKHYLRTLFSIAANVRDRRLSGLRTEPTIKRTLRRYLSWALFDAGVHPTQRPKVIPVHAIATLRKGEESPDVIKRMSKKLYHLARRYQDLYRIHQSVEPPHPTQPPTKEPRNPSPPEYNNNHMPTLIGLMIASSVVAIVTLDSRSSPPTQTQDDPPAETKPSLATARDQSGLRFIANFDFSTHDGYDVWDGFAMAICIMRIRKTMLELAEWAEREGQAGQAATWFSSWANCLGQEDSDQEIKFPGAPELSHGYSGNMRAIVKDDAVYPLVGDWE